ncbi:hypothetical protein O181_075946 [Austropuccinia psidii MF-1]|uniref:Integrase catalytic domain-containing protein n=1 Tax=Austropuccinia psidii MF-1 TaxID=1389203 RepID=A0A9Q3IAN4_9BASI|nr:hypothetical protein [Austropuccinia psidii MF-1]
MLLSWTTYFMGDLDYFKQSIEDSNIKRNLVARLFIQHSVKKDAYEAVTSCIHGSDAHKIYQALKDRFNCLSWSSVVYHANTIFQNRNDHVNDINIYAMTINEAVQNLEHQLGRIDSEMITTLAIFFVVPSMHQHITPAINTLMATNPCLKVRQDDLLNMILQIATASPNFDHSTEIAQMNAASKFGTRHKSNTHTSNKNNFSANKTASSSYCKREAKTRSSQYPCHYCGKVGHWSPNCPIRVKANEIKNKTRRQQINVAGMGVVPMLESNEALLDSSATHSVVGNLSLFTYWKQTNMRLSVASSESFKVNAIGSIALDTPYGILWLNNVLYCRDIPGVILSLGHLLQENFSISFLNQSFHLFNKDHNFSTIKRNNRWFIPFDNSSKTSITIKSISSSGCTAKSSIKDSQDESLLWHRRIGHLSIRHLTPDLMGPYESSLNNKKYILMIQDAFSRVIVAISLADKSEARTCLMNWIRQFLNVTNYKIKIIRTDNGTEFKNHLLNNFLTKNCIIHEYSMPYEHHQNGRIERTNRTISEMAQTCLLAANLPAFLWPWVFRHLVWIFNCYLHAEDKITPFEILGKKRPSLELLWVFGAKSFIYDHNFRKDFSARAVIGYHVGISEDSKGWLFWVPAKKTIIKSASVLFDESKYYVTNAMCNADVDSIQVCNIFDGSMINELNKQDWSASQLSKQNGLEISIPSTYREAMTSEHKTNWSQAIDDKIESMQTKDVFLPVDLNVALKEVPHESILSTKWVFTKKPKRFKARLVARGFHQIHGINYDDTFAPTPTFNSLHLLFSTACLNVWKIRTFDVKVAFLHSLIDKLVYVWPPMGINVPKFKVLKVKKALYGTKQASRCWWMHLKDILQKIGFKINGEDPSTHTLIRDNEQAILWVHIDNGALTASSPGLLDEISRQLSKYLKIKWDKTISGLVGISITENDKGFKFWQPDLIDKLTNLNPRKIIAKPLYQRIVS